MFLTDLNFYSVLIPIMIIALGSITLIFHCFHALPRYLRTYALAMICLGTSVLLLTILITPVLIACMTYVMAIYFLSCVLHIYAIQQRLMIDMLWGHILTIVLLGLCAIFYFSIIDDHQTIRLIIIGITTSFIYLHNIHGLLQKKHLVGLDYLLHTLVWAVVIIATCRALGLAILINSHLIVSNYDPIWALTQLLLIFIDVVFLGLFIACATSDLLRKLRDERNIDLLTGCLNRRGLNDHLQHLKQQPIQLHALLLCDLDHFKQINTQYGHHVGDLALQHFCHLARKLLSRSDEIIRIGGEEFLLLLHDIEQNTAPTIAEKIQLQLAETPLIYQGQRIVFSLSIGVSYFHFLEDFDDALNLADRFLYSAKKAGRNQIKVQHPLSITHTL
jgi:diguanylate cyclase (GGDEF)-like protein